MTHKSETNKKKVCIRFAVFEIEFMTVTWKLCHSFTSYLNEIDRGQKQHSKTPQIDAFRRFTMFDLDFLRLSLRSRRSITVRSHTRLASHTITCRFGQGSVILISIRIPRAPFCYILAFFMCWVFVMLVASRHVRPYRVQRVSATISARTISAAPSRPKCTADSAS